MKISNLFRVTDALDISKRFVEKNIIAYRDHNAQTEFNLRFPYKLTPLVLRVISHIPGDGNIRRDGFARWTQIDHSGMYNLLVKIGFKNISTNGKSLCIPRFLIKLNCITLKLEPKDFKKPRFIETVIDLPRLYRVQVILALIEDEATIDVKNYGPINIRLADKDLIESYAKLCDSLNFNRSEIKGRKNTGFNTKNKIYKLEIFAEGIRKLKVDYDTAIKKFGKNGGLWKKDKEFRERCEKAISTRALKNKEGKKLTEEIIKLLSFNKELSVKMICKLLKTKDYNRVYDRVRYLCKIKKIKRSGYGKYILIKTL